MILVPIKDSAKAKQRLAPILEQSARTELARAMMQDVLDTLSAYGESKVSLVTSDPFAMDLANQYGFAIIRDDSNLSETDAIEMATQICASCGIESTLVIPADIPLITAAEIQTIYENAPERGSVLVPSGDGRGTNAVLRRPSSLFPLRFGNDSFIPHLNAAKACNAPCVVLSLAGIALDVDIPQDLARLAAVPGRKRSQLLARTLIAAAAPPFPDCEKVADNLHIAK